MIRPTAFLLNLPWALHFSDDQQVWEAEADELSAANAPLWQVPDEPTRKLRAFLKVEASLHEARRVRALTLGLAVSALAMLAFLIGNQVALPSLAYTTLLGMLALGACAGLTACAVASHRNSERNAMARAFYQVGLRVDKGMLISNCAHPTIIATA